MPRLGYLLYFQQIITLKGLRIVSSVINHIPYMEGLSAGYATPRQWQNAQNMRIRAVPGIVLKKREFHTHFLIQPERSCCTISSKAVIHMDWTARLQTDRHGNN
jgi:hypothetical protein